MAILTVFTPTYNRKYTLHKCYESLKRQTCKDFKWLIIDDGSTDDTKNLINAWIEEGIIDITYHYQENQGMHGAHNTAYELIDTEINTCIDSDDYMTDDAVEKIINFWNLNKREDIAGIAALDCYENGQVIGTKLPEHISETTYFELYNRYKVKGDKKFIYRSDLTKQFKYPIFPGEKYTSLAYKYVRIDENYKILLMNEPLCVVEYMPDGSTLNIFKQYRRNPRGFLFVRVHDMTNKRGSIAFKFNSCVHYVSGSIMIKNKDFLKESPCKFLTLLATPLGVLLYNYIIFKTKDASDL